jgi:dolichol kinase
MPLFEEILRKAVHSASVVIPVAAVFVRRTDMVLFLCAAALFLLLLDLLRARNEVFRKFFLAMFGRMLRPKEQEGGMTASTVVLASAALTIMVFRTEIAVASLVFLSFGDSSAALVGRHFGVTPLFGGRTLEGTLSALVACLGASWLLLSLSGDLGWVLTPGGLLAGSITAALAELVDLPLDDNLRIPIFAGLVMEFTIPG